MFMIPTAQGVSIAEFHQSELIDFPVWTLRQFGLKLNPFEAHGNGIDRLQSLEFNSVLWRDWFEKLVVFEHTESRLRCDGAASLIATRRTAFNSVPFIYDGMTAFEASIEQESAAVLERYYDLVSQLSSHLPIGSLPSESIDSPVALWQGSESVRSELVMLWKRYKARPYYRVHHASDLHRQLVRDSSLCEKVNETMKMLLEAQDQFVMVNFVNYPKNISTIVGSSIVIGMDVDKPFSVDDFMELLIESVSAIAS